MTLSKKDLVYIIIPFTLYLILFLFKNEESIEFNKLKEAIMLFLIVISFNVHPMISFCLYLIYLLNKHINI